LEALLRELKKPFVACGENKLSSGKPALQEPADEI
jgi:hypothetical protein